MSMSPKLVKEIENNNLTVLFITHDLMEAIRLSDEVLLLKADPGHIVHKFKFDVKQSKRDDEFVYKHTAQILSHEKIISTFELELKWVKKKN